MKTLNPRAALVIGITILALYAKTLFFDYTFLDDNVLVADNFWFISTLSSVPKAFTTDVFLTTSEAYYRPFLTLSFIPDAVIAGNPQNLAPFHLTNILLHICATLLLFVVLQKLGYKKRLSFFLAMLFAVHPALSQAVAWIPGRNDSLLAIWVLVSIISWLQFVSTKKTAWLVWHLLAFFGALLTKESAIVLPVSIIGIFIVYQKAHFSFTKWWLIAMGWLGVVLSWFVLRANVVSNIDTASLSYSPTAVMHNWPALAVYVAKALVPLHQSVLSIVDGAQPIIGLLLLSLIALYFCVLKYQKKPLLKLAFPLFWFFAFLAPAVFFHNSSTLWGQDLQLEHRLYVPLIGLLLFVAEVLSHVPKKYERAQWIVLGGLICILFVKTFVYLDNFKDRFSFWNQAVQSSPLSPLAHRNLGAMYHLTNDAAQAQSAYEKALALNPDEPMVHNNLGLIAQTAGDLTAAETLYRKEIAINPTFSLTYGNLAQLLFDQNKLPEARDLFLTMAKLEPNNAEPLRKYAQTFKTDDPERYQKLKQELESRGITLPE